MTRLALVLLLVGSPAFGWHNVGAAQAPTDFQITMKTTDAGVEMECQRGCEWTKLTFGCDRKVDCRAVVDAQGVHDVHGSN